VCRQRNVFPIRAPQITPGAPTHCLRSKRAFRSEFRVYAAKGGECPKPPEGGTPNGGNARHAPAHALTRHSCCGSCFLSAFDLFPPDTIRIFPP
jgi:hypothetical protein